MMALTRQFPWHRHVCWLLLSMPAVTAGCSGEEVFEVRLDGGRRRGSDDEDRTDGGVRKKPSTPSRARDGSVGTSVRDGGTTGPSSHPPGEASPGVEPESHERPAVEPSPPTTEPGRDAGRTEDEDGEVLATGTIPLPTIERCPRGFVCTLLGATSGPNAHCTRGELAAPCTASDDCAALGLSSATCIIASLGGRNNAGFCEQPCILSDDESGPTGHDAGRPPVDAGRPTGRDAGTRRGGANSTTMPSTTWDVPSATESDTPSATSDTPSPPSPTSETPGTTWDSADAK